MPIHALIPARFGSKGIPKKNIADVHGHPLIAYSIVAALECDEIDRVIVSTDAEEIAEVSLQYGAEVPFLRPAEFAQDNSTDTEVLLHLFEHIDMEEVAFLRPTSPLRDPVRMSEFIRIYHDDQKACSGLRSMHINAQPPYKVFKINEEGFCECFFEEFNGIKDFSGLPRQMFPQSYMPNGYLDICKKQTVLEGISAFGMNIRGVVTEALIDIDTMADLQLLRYKLGVEGHKLVDLLNKKHK